VGTALDCDVRLRRDLFLEPFALEFFEREGQWFIRCTDNIYIADGGVARLFTRSLAHGDLLAFKYAAAQADTAAFLTLDFSLDFESMHKDYSRMIDIAHSEQVTIGGPMHCDIVCRDRFLGSDFLTIQKRNREFFLIDNSAAGSARLNGNRIDGEARLRDHDFISIAGFSFYLYHGRLYGPDQSDVMVKENLASRVQKESQGPLVYPRFNRSTRVHPKLPTEDLTILDPPAKPQPQQRNFLLSLLPLLGTIVAAVLMQQMSGGAGGEQRIIMSIAMVIIGAITSTITFISGKRKYRKDVRHRIEVYHSYLDKKREEFAEERENERGILEELYCDLAANMDRVDRLDGRLFDRTPQDEDFLDVRLGVGTREAARAIAYKRKETIEGDDELEFLPEELSAEYRDLREAPVTLELAQCNAVGVIGPWDLQYGLFKAMVVDLSCRQYFKEVKLYCFTREDYEPVLSWLRFLPHFCDRAVRERHIACDQESRVSLYESLYKELSQREMAKDVEYAQLVVFVLEDGGFKTHPLSRFLDTARELNVTFLFFEPVKEELPLSCDRIITMVDVDRGSMVQSADGAEESSFTFHAPLDNDVTRLATRLAPVYCDEVSLEGTLTRNISLFELLRIFSVDELDLSARWSASQVTKSMAAPLGVRSKNTVVALDLHDKAHGPHGLVAGTTGSGKSEILQSYILSAITLFHPHELAFVIIDFKGGGMADQFTGLPHLVGTITNIDGKQIERSLKSIKAELVKRQRFFKMAGVNHIDKYIAKYQAGEAAEPLPHLVIIVDEFAELKAAQPEFMNELISAARVGRSLGVHLILATQKPAGQVNEQIWSNSRFKLCLKVQTREDSNEMIKSPLAAEIVEPGRAYFQVGNNEIFELFQSAYSGSSATMANDGSAVREYYIAEIDLSGRRKLVYARRPQRNEDEKTLTQLDAIVGYVCEHCERAGIRALPEICLPALPRLLPFPSEAQSNAYRVGIGRYDDPEGQYQGEVDLDLVNAHTIIIGSAQQGKTNLLQVLLRGLAASYTPEEATVYIIDFASLVLKNYEELAHVGGVVTPTDDEKLKNLFKLMSEEVAMRREKLVSAGVSSFAAYKEAGFTDLPLIVLMVDNITMLKELYFADDDPLLALCREGISVGISIVIANSVTSGIGYRYLASIANRVALYNNDSNEYGNLLDSTRMQPDNVAGRCLVSIDRTVYEAQLYLAFEGEKEIDRVQEIRAFIEKANDRVTGKARRIPEIPKLLTADFMAQAFPFVYRPYHVVAGLDYESVAPLRLDFSKLLSLGVVSTETAAKASFVKQVVRELAQDAAAAPVSITVIDDYERALAELEPLAEVSYSIQPSDIIGTVNSWHEALSQRYDLLMTQGVDGLKNEPLLLLVVAAGDALKALAENTDANERFKTIVSKYKALKVAVIVTAVENAPIPYGSNEVLKWLKDEWRFLCFDDLGIWKVTDVPFTESKRFKKRTAPGDAFYIREIGLTRIKVIDT
jgi:S-DNA-T family DNA segregation ATPase FtsK/SpoIIIE